MDRPLLFSLMEGSRNRDHLKMIRGSLCKAVLNVRCSVCVAFETNFKQSDEVPLKTIQMEADHFNDPLLSNSASEYLNLFHVGKKEHLFLSGYYTALIYDSSS